MIWLIIEMIALVIEIALAFISALNYRNSTFTAMFLGIAMIQIVGIVTQLKEIITK